MVRCSARGRALGLLAGMDGCHSRMGTARDTSMSEPRTATFTRQQLAQALDDHLPRMAFRQYGQFYNDDPDFDIEEYYDRVAASIIEEAERIQEPGTSGEWGRAVFRASSSDELRAALDELQSVLNGIRSDGPVMDSLTAEGPWWTPPDPTGVRLYDAIIGASDAIDRALSDSRRLRKEGIDASLASILDAFHGAIHDRCGEAWIEAETALASLVSDGWTRAALHASRLDADKEGEAR
jgi:hypothetical protein